MPRVEIRLRIDPTTQKKTITVAYESDGDALPFEHEEEHRRIVESLVQRGMLDASQAHEVLVERVETEQAEPDELPQGAAERAALGNDE